MGCGSSVSADEELKSAASSGRRGDGCGLESDSLRSAARACYAPRRAHSAGRAAPDAADNVTADGSSSSSSAQCPPLSCSAPSTDGQQRCCRAAGVAITRAGSANDDDDDEVDGGGSGYDDDEDEFEAPEEQLADRGAEFDVPAALQVGEVLRPDGDDDTPLLPAAATSRVGPPARRHRYDSESTSDEEGVVRPGAAHIVQPLRRQGPGRGSAARFDCSSSSSSSLEAEDGGCNHDSGAGVHHCASALTPLHFSNNPQSRGPSTAAERVAIPM